MVKEVTYNNILSVDNALEVLEKFKTDKKVLDYYLKEVNSKLDLIIIYVDGDINE